MADEDYGDLNLSQYGGSGRWLQSTTPAWIQRSSTNPSPQHNHIPGRYSGLHRGNSCEADDAAFGRAQARGRPGLYYSPPGTSYTIVERPVATTAITQQHHTPGIKPSRAYTGMSHSQPHSHSHTPRTAPSSAGKKRPMSPEDVLKMFGSTSKGTTHGRRSQSPASSPPSTTHHQYLYQNTHDDLIVRTVSMVRPPDSSHGFGICVKGGKDSDADGVGVYISRVEEGSVAERVGLRPGDSILEVNGTPFTAISHEEALKVIRQMLKSCRKLSMTVKSPNLPMQMTPLPPPTPLGSSGPWLMRQTYSWMDRQGRPVSPPLEYARAAPPVLVTPRWGYSSRSKEKGGTRKVDLNIEPGQSLGLMIRGGLEYNLGIFITGVDKDSVADRAGLMVGDQILEVNGQSFMDVTHDEAVNQLKIHKRMTIFVRDVGKVPHSCTAYDDHLWDPCSSTLGDDRLLSGKGCCPTLQMIEEKARVLLNRSELNSLSYYQEEYVSRQMTIEAFVTVLLELLNTPEKHNLLTELREVILPEDRARFDELVYRRPTIDHDRHGHRRKGCDSSHAMLMSNLHDLPTTHEYLATTRPCKIPIVVEGMPVNTEEFRTPSEDSGVCLGDSRTNERGTLTSSSPVYRKQTSDLTLSNEDCSTNSQDYSSSNLRGRRLSNTLDSRGSMGQMDPRDYDDASMSGYLEGLKSHFGGWTQRVKSWYWGRPLAKDIDNRFRIVEGYGFYEGKGSALSIKQKRIRNQELAHKLSRSFDMKEDQELIDSGGNMRRHQSMQRLSRSELADSRRDDDGLMGAMVVPDHQGNLRITVSKTKPILGIAIEGGANTKHPLPRIINIHENGAAYEAGGLEVGQLILEVDGHKVEGMHHQDIARLIAESFARREKHEIEFLVVEAKKSNLEPKPTALIFLEA